MSPAPTNSQWDILKLARLRELNRLQAEKTRREKTAAARIARRYLYDPVAWAHDAIDWSDGEGLTDYQSEVIAELPGRRRVAVRGPHGLGKSGVAAIVVLWFATTRDAAGIDWKVLTTASAWRHLSVYLWPEIHKWARRIKWEALGRPEFNLRTELLGLNLKMGFGAATAVASNKAALIEGAHADSLLYLLDEAKIIPSDTWDAIEGAFSGGRMDGLPEAFALAVSTPGPPTGRFYEIHKRTRGLEDWWTRHVTLDEAIAAGRISPEWAAQRRLQWGEDSALYHNRVLGEFYAGDEETVIPLSWVEAAVERWHVWDAAGQPAVEGRRWLGVDVARGGTDSTVLARRVGPCVESLEAHHREDTMQTTSRVLAAIGDDREYLPIVDSIGVGGGVVDRLRELKVPVLAYTGSARTAALDRTREHGFVNCLTGNARVRPVGRLLRVYRSRYEGPLFHVKTAGGDEFTATANHQVLTVKGWVSVQTLRVGDQLCDTRSGDVTVTAAVRPEVDDMPPAIGEIYGAADRLFGAKRMQGTAVDFHGDRPVGEVDVVTINRELFRVDPVSRQRRQDVKLIRPLLGPCSLLGDGLLAEGPWIGDGDRRIASALPDCEVPSRARLPLSKGQAVKHEVIGFRYGARPDAALRQCAPNGAVGNTELVSELISRLASLVPPDRLLFVEDRPKQSGGVILRPERDPVLAEHPANHVHVDTEALRESIQGRASGVAGNDGRLIHVPPAGEQDRLVSATWLDAMFVQDVVNGGPVSPEELGQRLERFTGDIPLDEIVSVELAAAGHELSYVYTLETDTGSYMTHSIAHRNCRSAAYWHLRELLDPAFRPEVMLPPDDLLLADLNAPTWDTVTGIPPKIRIELKEDLVKRLGRSPDHGDSVVMAFWGDALRHEAKVAVPTGQLPSSGMSGLSRQPGRVGGSGYAPPGW